MGDELTRAQPDASLSHLRRINQSFDPECREASCLRLLQELSEGRKQVQSSDITCTQLTDGITNTIIKVTVQRPDSPSQETNKEAVLVRAYGSGTEAIIDREKELRAHSLLASVGLASELLATFDNGFIHRFIPGKPCTPQDYHDRDTSRLIARKLGAWHAKLPISALTQGREELAADGKHTRPFPSIWSNVRKWIAFLPHNTVELKKRNDVFLEELAWLEGLFLGVSGPHGRIYVFSHTDLLCANVILSDGSEGRDVTFIDYEYATTAPAAFDIANVSAEWAGPDQEYSWMPSKSQRWHFIEHYVDSFYEASGTGVTRTSPRSNDHVDERALDVSRLFNQVDLMRGLSGFYWGIWGLCQASISDIDFDYNVYAERRHSEYWGWKAEYTGMRARDGMEMTVRERAWARE